MTKNTDSITVIGEINGKEHILILDTGASHSIIRRDLVVEPTTPLKGVTLRTATGEQGKIKGTIEREVTIGPISLKHRFVVADIVEEIIIGLDFMIAHGFVLDLEQLILRYKNVEISLTSGPQEDVRVNRIAIVDKEEIPANSETLIWAKILGNPGNKTPVIIEPVNDSVMVARSLGQINQEYVPVRIINPSPKPMVLKAGEIVAQCEKAEIIIDCGEEIQSEPFKSTKSMQSSIQEWTEGLPQEERIKAEKFLKGYSTIFAQSGEIPGRTNLIKHRINTGECSPIRQRPRRLPLAKREEVEKLIDDMRKEDVIEPSHSPWCSPVVLVKKKDGSTRFCVDYRKLNNVTRKDSYPLPRIDDTLDTLSGSKWFSTLDLKSGYWQVRVSEEDKEKTAFSFGEGLWQFKVMPFGLCNAPATFERLMDLVLRGLNWKICLVYLDDIVVLGGPVSEIIW